MPPRAFSEKEARDLLRAIDEVDQSLGPGREFAYEIVRQSGGSVLGIADAVASSAITLLDDSTPANTRTTVPFDDIAEVRLQSHS